jgi:hypothetical protein
MTEDPDFYWIPNVPCCVQLVANATRQAKEAKVIKNRARAKNRRLQVRSGIVVTSSLKQPSMATLR